MGKSVHVVLSYDADAGTVQCQHCGVVPAKIKHKGRDRKGRARPPGIGCSVGINAQKARHTNRSPHHGLNQPERTAFLVGKVCGVCGTTEGLVVDHDHRTGELRGALCTPHNTGLGLLGDDLDGVLRAVEYLRSGGPLMELTLCDLCPRSALSEATFRIEFQRIGGVGGMTDPSIDVCKKHYDKIYETTVTSTP